MYPHFTCYVYDGNEIFFNVDEFYDLRTMLYHFGNVTVKWYENALINCLNAFKYEWIIDTRQNNVYCNFNYCEFSQFDNAIVINEFTYDTPTVYVYDEFGNFLYGVLDNV